METEQEHFFIPCGNDSGEGSQVYLFRKTWVTPTLSGLPGGSTQSLAEVHQKVSILPVMLINLWMTCLPGRIFKSPTPGPKQNKIIGSSRSREERKVRRVLAGLLIIQFHTTYPQIPHHHPSSVQLLMRWNAFSKAQPRGYRLINLWPRQSLPTQLSPNRDISKERQSSPRD